MRLIDDEAPAGARALSLVYRGGAESTLIGITGSPGSGKSTLVDQLIHHGRKRAKRVAVVAIDPSSPISGGAVLADRARMSSHALDEGVFIRSLASRGHPGGLSVTTSATVRVLEALGFDPVLIETVGIGQSEVEVASLAPTVALVLAPGMGDDLQAMKAGVLEVPDVFVVNKADREGADRVARDVEAMLELANASRAPGWHPRVVQTVAIRGEGIDALVETFEAHRAHLIAAGEIQARRVARARLEIENALVRALHARANRAARRTHRARCGGGARRVPCLRSVVRGQPDAGAGEWIRVSPNRVSRGDSFISYVSIRRSFTNVEVGRSQCKYASQFDASALITFWVCRRMSQFDS